jgi:hypothetical protein
MFLILCFGSVHVQYKKLLGLIFSIYPAILSSVVVRCLFSPDINGARCFV